jgi:hypothetical protein
MRPGVHQAENDRSALHWWHEWQLEDGKRRIILCVATDLELRPGFPGFDSDRLRALVAEANQISRASASPINAIRIVPER